MKRNPQDKMLKNKVENPSSYPVKTKHQKLDATREWKHGQKRMPRDKHGPGVKDHAEKMEAVDF